MSPPVPRASCGHPLDWAMSGVSERRRWGRTARCGWGIEDQCYMDVHLGWKFSVCKGGRRVDSVQLLVWRVSESPRLGNVTLFVQLFSTVIPILFCFIFSYFRWTTFQRKKRLCALKEIVAFLSHFACCNISILTRSCSNNVIVRCDKAIYFRFFLFLLRHYVWKVHFIESWLLRF